MLVILTDFHGPEAAPHCYQLSKNTDSFLEKFPQGQDSPSNPPNLLMAKLPSLTWREGPTVTTGEQVSCF